MVCPLCTELDMIIEAKQSIMAVLFSLMKVLFHCLYLDIVNTLANHIYLYKVETRTKGIHRLNFEKVGFNLSTSSINLARRKSF